MPLFDITSGIKAHYQSGAAPQVAYDILKKVVVQFAKRGYDVEWREQKPPTRLVAKLTDKDGTDLVAECNVVDEDTVTRCDLNIHGHVFLGGLLGRLVSASTIQSRAQEKIKEMLDEHFAGQPAKRAPKPAPKPAGSAAATVSKPQQPTATAAAAKMTATPAATRATATAAAATATAADVTNVNATDESWQALVERALGGAPIAAAALTARAAAAAAALGDASLIQFVQIGLVQALAKSKGQKLDRAAAVQVLAKIGAASSTQLELAHSAKSGVAAAFALTAAVGEAVLRSFDGVDAASLPDLFEAEFEKNVGRMTAKLARGGGVSDKLAQVKEAYDADLISESEMLVLKERVLASL